MKIKNVCILGAGTLGTRVALQAALSQFNVRIYDINPKALDTSKKTMETIVHQLAKSSGFEADSGLNAIQGIFFTDNPQVAVQDADIINESVLENVKVKNEVWELFGQIAPEKTIFTTNTSFLLPSMFAEISGRPERFCALHFHDVFYAKGVDIMPHPGTDPKLIPVLEAFGRSLEQVPVVIQKENHGYLFNAMLGAILSTAGKLLANGVGSVEAIDKSYMVNFRVDMGPFAIMDSIGLDTVWHVTVNNNEEGSKAFAALLKGMLDQGKAGVKSGEGFYKYPNPAFRQPGFLS
ncbi:3-hydroxybutyryl-CoA dehydrogenase [Mariniradius saccharolyticus AK6]|uniref:3-hydroxybutyryl-CoA dehydrogenase n=1 Tax=Mariniradius saccharolyticus AK6 TaxID=1239962 RepID=M7Y5U5_9BACT|nr:3-hydroxyacyl-CoA dehydrogenase NAD-binding domain-containing protein [Mariniradius saccharolyticus]EMS32626.1 3-hydroxybutyryl-CoA dehydrogenase [Mariniradius saccharolyticus AK6]